MESHLRHLLDEVSTALGRARPEDRQELADLHGTVEAQLAGEQPAGPRGFSASLERAEGRFESDHPRLAGAIRQTLQALSDAGI
ncbi:MAG TPA: DUF4404 family protein [Sporichthyaceae bacterium]